MGLEQKISLLEEENGKLTEEQQLREHIRRVWGELGLLKWNEDEKTYSSTKKGQLLFDSHSLTRDRLRYWLQDRYVSAWLPTSTRGEKNSLRSDHFSNMANNPDLVALSQRVLHSYATQDWQGIASALPRDLFQASTIVDLGGGMGALLQELSKSCSSQRLICIDRPEVIRLSASSSKIEFRTGDLFSGSLPPADCYLLSRVLHDWPDEQAKEILSRIPADSLCVVEREVDPTTNEHALLSLHMFLLNHARERTRADWDRLFSDTHWLVQSRTPFSGHVVTALKKMKNITYTPASVISSSSRPTNVRKVVLPVAGLGTRMRPQSAVLPKALLPIVQNASDRWTCRPVLDLLLEEIFAHRTGIEEVFCIVAPEQEYLFQSYLSSSPYNIRFIPQPSPKGFGHAVLLAEEYLRNEPFVVMLGDHLYRANANQSSCLQQLLDAYRQHASDTAQVGLTGVMTCAREEISQTGLLQAAINMRDEQFFQITDMAEKPEMDVAMTRFQSARFPNRFLCQAGIDILPATIFAHLRQREQQLHQTRDSSELGLREAMNSLRHNGQLHGCMLDGQRFDIGHPKEYYRTLKAFTSEPTSCKDERSTSNEAVWSLLQETAHIRALFSTSTNPIYSASAPGRLDVMGGGLPIVRSCPRHCLFIFYRFC